MAIPWITGDDLSDPSNPLADEAAKSASFILYKLSAEKYAGIREVTDVYALADSECSSCLSTDIFVGTQSAHRHILMSPSSTAMSRLRLRGRPVNEIISVSNLDGEVIDPSQYRLANAAYIVHGASGCWDIRRGLSVTYSYGVKPPAMGVAAAIKLGNEFLKLYTAPDECQLPERVTSVTRQGISYTILDPQTFLENGRTGIYEIDLFLKAVNPLGAKKRPRVFSPDTPRGER